MCKLCDDILHAEILRYRTVRTGTVRYCTLSDTLALLLLHVRYGTVRYRYSSFIVQFQFPLSFFFLRNTGKVSVLVPYRYLRQNIMHYKIFRMYVFRFFVFEKNMQNRETNASTVC